MENGAAELVATTAPSIAYCTETVSALVPTSTANDVAVTVVFEAGDRIETVVVLGPARRSQLSIAGTFAT